MKFGDLFESEFFKSEHLDATEQLVLTICGIKKEKVGDETKPVARFNEDRRGLVLNITRAAVLKDAYGENLDNWKGRRVGLRRGSTMFQGKRVHCIDVEIPENNGSVAPTGDEGPF